MPRTDGPGKVWKRILKYGLESIGIWYSNYRGFVFNVDDPLGMGRIQVQVPAVDGNHPDPTWAFPKNMYGGNDYGVQMLPKVGDLVWVSYEYGMATKPMWEHAGWATGERPEEFSSKTTYGFKTPNGALVSIEDGLIDGDEVKGQEITITTKSGKRIFISDEAGIQIDAGEEGNVEIKGGKGIIELSEQGISIDTQDKPLWLNGSNRILYAKSEFASEILHVRDIGISDSTRTGD